MKLALIFILFCGFSAAQACIEVPKTVNLQNSPFPFKAFSLTSQSFAYTTSDGMVNTLHCEEQSGAYSWAIATEHNKVVKQYGYADIKAAKPFTADSNETGNTTPLHLTNTGEAAFALFSKQNGRALMELTCSVENNIMTMNVRIQSDKGLPLANISAAKLGGTRSVVSPPTPTVDFSSTTTQNVEFAGCGVAAPAASGAPATQPPAAGPGAVPARQ